jgi:hypothetical protein
MELTTATINSILLPPFLFVVTFCFLCCQLPLKSYTTATIGSKTEAETVTTTQSQDEPYTALEIQTLIEPAPARIQDKELQADLWETPVVEEPTKSEPNTLLVEDKEDVPVEQDAPETVTSAEPISSQQTELEAQAIAAIDNLGKREARKIMGALKLQQKRNGVELSTELMVASIKREFKASPERVIEAIRLRLPELLSNDAASQADQLAS